MYYKNTHKFFDELQDQYFKKLFKRIELTISSQIVNETTEKQQ